jgi:hypothetical protein
MVHNSFCFSLKDTYFSKRDQLWCGRYRCKNYRVADSGGLSHGACTSTLRVDQQPDGSFIIDETHAGAENHLDFCKEQANISNIFAHRPNGIYDAHQFPNVKNRKLFTIFTISLYVLCITNIVSSYFNF